MYQSTVLLVEDEPLIALDLQVELEASGCKVVAATDAQEAIELSGQFSFDLAILNFYYKNSPNGVALAQRLHLGPDTRLLFVTGTDIKDLMPSNGAKATFQVLQKPFSRRQLRSFLLP